MGCEIRESGDFCFVGGVGGSDYCGISRTTKFPWAAASVDSGAARRARRLALKNQGGEHAQAEAYATGMSQSGRRLRFMWRRGAGGPLGVWKQAPQCRAPKRIVDGRGGREGANVGPKGLTFKAKRMLGALRGESPQFLKKSQQSLAAFGFAQGREIEREEHSQEWLSHKSEPGIVALQTKRAGRRSVPPEIVEL